MKRPGLNLKGNWLSMAGVLFLMLALVMGVASSAKAATGSFDRDHYLPQLGTSDYDRAWIMVEDSTATGTTISVTIQALTSGESATYTLVGGSSTAFTTHNGQATLPHATAIGSSTGFVEDFAGNYNYPALASGFGALKLITGGLGSSEPGNAANGTNGVLKVNSSDTLALVYSGATLDTASVSIVGANDSTIEITTASPWGTSLESGDDIADATANVKITVVDPNVNLNPNLKDIIGLQDGFTRGLTGTGSTRVQVEVVDQNSTTGAALSGAVASNIILVETGKNTGSFVATGKVYGSSSVSARGNLQIGTGTLGEYSGGAITLSGDGASVTFKIVEVTKSGTLALVGNGTSSTYGTWTLQYGSSTWSTTAYGSTTYSASRVVAGTGSSQLVSIYGSPEVTSNAAASTYVKLIDGSDYCLVAISAFDGEGTADTHSTSTIATGGAGSTSVNLDTFFIAGARSGDSVKVSYLDALTAATGESGTVTSSTAFGATGVSGTVEVDKTSVDINDFLTITVVDGNLNTSSTSRGSVAYGSWDGTTTSSRGDRLKVAGYSSSSFVIDLQHQDGSRVGTQSVRIFSTDGSLGWLVPNSLSDSTYGFRDPLTSGSSSFKLGTQSTSSLPLIALVKGDSTSAQSALSGATTSSFVATTDAVGGTVEISPDGTYWVAVPVTETGINSSTFVGTVGFDFTAARVTTDSNTANSTSIFSDYTGTSSITFSSPMTSTFLSRTIGTGSVVRISDGLYKEFREVTGVSGATLSVTKMQNTGFYTPWKTWVQVVGNDMDPNRADTISGTQLFRIGGYFGATYRVRYNDALNADGAYASGDNLAITASNNATFVTETASLTVPSDTAGLNAAIVVTLVDNDLNTNTTTSQSTYYNSSITNAELIGLHEVGLGFPSGTSTGNTSAASSDLAKKNGGAAKIVFASNSSSVTSANISSVTTSNTTHFVLTETAANSGTFKGSFNLTSSGSTDQSTPQLKVASGDTVTVYYNDSPSASAENNLQNFTTVSFGVASGNGALALSKEEAFLSGDSIVVTLTDSDLDTNPAGIENAEVYVTSSSGSGSITVSLAETAVSSGEFAGTFKTGASTDSTTTPKTIRAVANGVVTVTYQENSPARDVTAQVSTKNFGAVLDITDDTVALGGNAVVSLYDPESNTSIGSQDIVSTLNVKSTTDSTGVLLQLTETGNDTGSFLGTIQVSSSSSLQNTRIQAQTGDTITATFTDIPNADGGTSVATDTATVGEVATPLPSPTPGVTPTPGASPAPTVTPPGTGSVEGFVTDAVTGDGIEGATVRNQSGVFTGTTDADGYYSIVNVEAGTRTFTALALGYTSSAPAVIVVTAGETTNLDFALVASVTTSPVPTVTPPPTATLVVAVSDENGPLAGATVTVDGQSGVTDANGGATFTLEAGDYEVSVSATGYVTSVTTVTVTLTPPVTIHEVTLEIKKCEAPDTVVASDASVAPDILSLAKGDSEDVIVSVTGDDCPAQGVKVKRKLTSANKKKIKVTPASAKTDENGEATFTVKAKKNKGKASVKFGVKGVKVTPKVNVSLSK